MGSINMFCFQSSYELGISIVCELWHRALYRQDRFGHQTRIYLLTMAMMMMKTSLTPVLAIHLFLLS